MDGILIVNKPAELTSHDVVARARHLLHERRIGHTGTLDPFATGVLVLLVGRATRLAQFLNAVEKEYEAVVRLGYATDSGDLTGHRITPPTNERLKWSEEEVEKALSGLRGNVKQIPPMYSAKKKDGRKLYELARRGEEIMREAVPVSIYELEPIKTEGQLIKDNLDGTYDLQLRVVCSSGTYVRTLAEDFGKRLGVAAHLAELRRTRVGDFRVDSANTLADLQSTVTEEALGTILISPDAALARLPFVHLNAEDARRARHGIDVMVAQEGWIDKEAVRMRDAEGQLIAIGSFDATRKCLHPRVVLAAEK